MCSAAGSKENNIIFPGVSLNTKLKGVKSISVLVILPLGRAEHRLLGRELDYKWQRKEKENLRPKYVPHFVAAQSTEELLIPYVTALRQATQF